MRFRTDGAGRRPYLLKGVFWCMVLKKGQLRVCHEGLSESCAEPCPTMAKLPALWDFLVQTRWEDGTSRVTGTLTMSLYDGLLRIALNDRDSESSSFLCGKSFTSLLKAANEALEAGKLEFRENPWKKRKPVKKNA